MCGGFIFECGRVGMDMTFLSYMHKRLHTLSGEANDVCKCR